jgi:hypothetical protein
LTPTIPGRTIPLAPAAAGAAVGAAAVVLAIIKAATASIAHDEAVTYVAYVAGPWKSVAENYTAGNHVLFTLLARLSTLALGGSELALRLPALLGSAVAAAVLWRILRFATAGWLMPLGMASVLLNPMVLDNLAMGRGYSLALAAFLAGLLAALRALATRLTSAGAWAIGLSLGLAIAFNLTALLPAVGLAAAFLAMLGTTHREAGGLIRRETILAAFFVPALLALALNLWAMEWRVGRHHFWYGTTTLPRMVASLEQRALFHEAPKALVPVDEVVRSDRLSKVVGTVVTPAVIAGVAAAAAAVLLGALRLRRRPARPARHLLALCAATLAATVLALVAAHEAFGVLYPRGRTGLCLAATSTLGLVATAVECRAGTRPLVRVAGSVAAGILLAFVARFAGQLRLDRFGEAYAEAAGRRTFDALETLAPASARPPVRVVAQPPVYGPPADFYRLVRNATWMAPVDRTVEPGVRYDAVLADDATAGSEIVRALYREIARDPESGAVVLVAR